MYSVLALSIVVPVFLPIVILLLMYLLRVKENRAKVAQQHRDRLDRQKVDDIVEMATDQECTLLEMNYSSQRDRLTVNKHNEYN